MKKLILTKENVKIELSLNTDKVTIFYEFGSDDKDNLEDYIYLLEKIEKYMQSGEYQIEEKKESA